MAVPYQLARDITNIIFCVSYVIKDKLKIIGKERQDVLWQGTLVYLPVKSIVQVLYLHKKIHHVYSRNRRFYSQIQKHFTVVMVRHGQSEWNLKNLFCGWYDACLTERGREEARHAGRLLKEKSFIFDVVFISALTRAEETASLILCEMGLIGLPTVKSWRLNERHYGDLTGKNKAEAAKKYGEGKVKMWRRSFDVPPPPMKVGHPFYKMIAKDRRYADDPTEKGVPKYESLKMTMARTLPFWKDTIAPIIKYGCRVLIVAHGNSLRGIVKHIDNISDQKISKLNLPTGIPFVYTLDCDLKPIRESEVGSFEFLGDPETLKQAIESVENQGKAK